MRYLISILLTLLIGCTGIPDGIKPVTGFELARYLGTWHEIARLDHRFERGLSDISAEYSLLGDGGVKVVNSGYNTQKAARESATGKAYFIDGSDIGRLKVSFFRPFYDGYNIIALDKTNYQWVMICGPDRDYLWILSRNPNLDKTTLHQLISQAKALGFATEKLIFR